MDLETWENPSIEEQHSRLLYGHSESYHAEPHKGINNEHIEKTNMMQSVEYQSQLSSSHIEFPYDLEPLGAYTMSYHSVSLDDQYDGVVNLPHHSNLYINPIHSWIEATYAGTYQFGRKFDDIIHSYDFPSILPLPDHHAGLHFLNKVSLLWLVTKDNEFFLC